MPSLSPGEAMSSPPPTSRQSAYTDKGKGKARAEGGNTATSSSESGGVLQLFLTQ